MIYRAIRVRPAVCLTNETGPHGHIILAFITSRIPDPLLDSDIVFDITDPDAAPAGLKVSSTLQLHRLMTVSRSMLLCELGVLSPPMRYEVEQKLIKLFGLDRDCR
jgi:mRNA interferase MazF